MHNLILLNYTSDLSGSTIALKRLIQSLEGSYSMTVLTSKGSYLSSCGSYSGCQYVNAFIPRMERRYNPVFWLRYIIHTKKLEKQVRRLYTEQNAKALVINCLENYGAGFLNPKGMNLIWWVHELYLTPQWLFRAIAKKVQYSATKILCVSQPVMDLFSEKSQLLPNGVYVPNIDSIENPLEKDALDLIWVGTVSPRKGLHTLGPLLLDLKEKWLNIKLTLYGSYTEKYKAYYEECFSSLANLDISLQRKDNTPDEEIDWASSKILIQTSSLPESFSLPVLEAMAYGMLVLCSEKGGVRDFGQHGKNLLFLQQIKGKIADALWEYRNSPDRLHSIQKLARNTAQNYSLAKLGERFKKALES